MITPENNTPANDEQAPDAQDQQSQQDIQSDGIEEITAAGDEEQADPAMLQQAYDAAEPSYTLDVEKDRPTKPEGE